MSSAPFDRPLSDSVDPRSVEGLFLSALGKSSPEERAAFLDQACGQDADRRRRVEALLRAYDDAGSFMERPAAGLSGMPGTHADASLESLAAEFLAPAGRPGLLGTLGPYDVIEPIGRGGMGLVYRALDPKLNRVVAIKMLAPELSANPAARRRFLREAQAAAAISHPHVVTIFAVDEAASPKGRGAIPYLVMECIVGQSLQQKIDNAGPLRLAEILRIGKQMAEGLAAAHKQGLIHRDIKPANILLENGVERVKITDFGLARAVDDVTITRTGEVTGTPQFMSPEQAKGDAIDQRSDLFSLGCVLYAMCTGRSPFRSSSLAEAIKRVCDDEPRPIAEQNPDLPGWLGELIDRLLRKRPEERIQSASEVADLLAEHLAQVQAAQMTPPRGMAPATYAARRPVAAALPAEARRIHAGKVVAAVAAGLFCGLYFDWSKWNSDTTLGLLGGSLAVLAGVAMLCHGSVRLRRMLGEAGLTPVSVEIIGASLIAGCALVLAIRGVIDPAFDVGQRIYWPLLVNGFLIAWVLFLRLGRQHWMPRTARATSPRDQDASREWRPGRILAWLGVFILTVVIVIPILLIVALAIPAYQAAQFRKQPERHPRTDAVPVVNSSEPVTGGMSASIDASEAAGIVYVKFLDEGLQVEFGSESGFPQAVDGTSESEAQITLGAADYSVSVLDTFAGWVETGPDLLRGEGGMMSGGMSSVAMPTYAGPVSRVSGGKITVKPGETATLTVSRDYQKLADAAPDFSKPQIHSFLWLGRRYSLSSGQAKVVNELLSRLARGLPGAPIITLVGHPGDDELKALFNDGQHPAWGSLVMFDEKSGNYSLPAPPPRKTDSPSASPDKSGAAGGQAPMARDDAKGADESSSEDSTGVGGSFLRHDNLARAGYFNIDIQDQGLLVAIRRKSTFSGKPGGDEEVFTEVGFTQIPVATGEYQVLIRDELFGWRHDGKWVREGRTESARISAQGFTDLKIHRDLARHVMGKEARERPAIESLNSGAHGARPPAMPRFLWNGEEYVVDNRAAHWVDHLLYQFSIGEPEVSLSEAEAGQLAKLLEDSGPRAAWGSLIVPGKTPGSYRLAEMNLGTLTIEIRDSHMMANVSYPSQNDIGRGSRVVGAGTHSFQVLPGDYRIDLTDHVLGWCVDPPFPGGGQPNCFGGTTTVTVRTGQTSAVAFGHDLKASIAPKALGSGPAGFFGVGNPPMFRFLYFGANTNDFTESHSPLDARQAEVIARLVRATVEGHPDVAEAELLKDLPAIAEPQKEVAAGEKPPTEDPLTFEKLFSGFDESQLRKLIVPGEAAGSWKLAPPPQTTSQTGSTALPAELDAAGWLWTVPWGVVLR